MTNLTFLLIDDDSDDREVFMDVLNRVDDTITCKVAEDADAAGTILQQLTPSVIFLDINMPRKNGWQFLKEIKQHEKLRSIPTIMYSTSSHPRDREAALGLGAYDFITKTYDTRELERLLKGVADRLLSQ